MPPEIRRLLLAEFEFAIDGDYDGIALWVRSRETELRALLAASPVPTACECGHDAGDHAYSSQHCQHSACQCERYFASSPAPPRQDDHEDPRVEPSVVAQKHGDLPRSPQPKSSQR